MLRLSVLVLNALVLNSRAFWFKSKKIILEQTMAGKYSHHIISPRDKTEQGGHMNLLIENCKIFLKH